MCLLDIHAQSDGRRFEVFPEETENAELTAEEAVSHVLLNLFGEVTVDDVTVHFSSTSRTGLYHCSIQIHAQCSCRLFALLPRTKENMKLAVEKSLCSILKELFGPVNVDSVTFSPSPWDYGNNPALSRRGRPLM